MFMQSKSKIQKDPYLPRINLSESVNEAKQQLSRFPGSSRLHWSEFLPSVGKTVNLLPNRNWTILIRFAICIHTTLANASSFCFITFCKSSRRRLTTFLAISSSLKFSPKKQGNMIVELCWCMNDFNCLKLSVIIPFRVLKQVA